MGPSSLSMPLSPTTPLSLSPLPSRPSFTSTHIPSPLKLASQTTVMSSSVRNNTGQGVQPPRPPNAWILYRSDKLQQLPPPALGQPKPTQAEVSKIISAQWRAEPEEVRAFYDQRAEMAKAEHARLYPNYRFAPMKRAEKDRIREEKRQAKEQERVGRRIRGRAAPYPLPCIASTSTTQAPLVFKHVISDPKDSSPPISSASSPSTGTPPSHLSVNVALRHRSAGVSPDASTDSQLHPIDLQRPSSRETSNSTATVPAATPLPAVPVHLRLSTPQPTPPSPQGWQPHPNLDSTTAFLSPLQDFSLADWPQTLPQSNEVPLENDNLSFSMPGLDNVPLQDTVRGSLLAELYDTSQPGIFQLQGVANPGLIAAPPGSIDLGVGMYPPGMCGSSAFDDALRILGEDPTTFMSNPTPEELFAALSVLAPPQPHAIDPPPPVSTDPPQAFNFDEYLQDFGSFISQESTDNAPTMQPLAEDQDVSVTLSFPQNSPSAHSGSVASPMPSFYATTPSPASTEPTPPPQPKQPYVPPRGAANTSSRRVGGNWKVPLAISRIASPLPSCAASPKRAAA
ncbi:hypothetical protein BJV78DRAFT_656455 [Lactifluus subvellereus]|nr:hypothetical protein BJV78DRAFT_656455 [Lactifluus subvellereus]